MAKNRLYATGDEVVLKPIAAPNDPPKSGDPVKIGAKLAGVMLKDSTGTIAANGIGPVALVGVYNLAVKGNSGAGGAAIAVGDQVFYDTGANGPVNSNSAGALIGTALDAVLSGATTTIRVLLGH